MAKMSRSNPTQRKARRKRPRLRGVGVGGFAGVFHLAPNDVRDLSGTFKSDLLGWNGYEFPLLSGALQWTPSFFEVRNARAKAFGGDTTFGYLIKPLGDKARPMARFDVDYKDMDLAAFMDHQGWPGLRFAGLASGHHVMEWPLGALRDWQNDGQMIVTAPDGVRTMTPTLAAGRAPEWDRLRRRRLPGTFRSPRRPAIGSTEIISNSIRVTCRRRARTSRSRVRPRGATARGLHFT